MREKVLALLLEVNEEIGDYEGSSMLEDEVITSLEVIEIVSALEDEFDVEVPYMEMLRRKTFKDVADYIAGLFGE